MSDDKNIDAETIQDEDLDGVAGGALRAGAEAEAEIQNRTATATNTATATATLTGLDVDSLSIDAIKRTR